MIAVFGAGSIGCWIGGHLAAAGADVVLIGRARILDELLAHGLTISDLDGTTQTLAAAVAGTANLDPGQIRTSVDPAVAADATTVLVAVKSAQTAEAGSTLARVLRRRTSVISLQNGVRNIDVLRAALPEHAVAAGMVPFNVVRRAPGSYHRATSGRLVFERERSAGWFAAMCTAAGLATDLHDDMSAVQWAKLIMNLNNAINALSGRPLAAQLADRSYRRCLAAAQREALGLLAQTHQPLARLTPIPPRWIPALLGLPDAPFRILARRMIAIDPDARSSMWDDLEAHRPTEIEYLQGEVVALAERLGLDAPANRAIVRLVRDAEAGGRRDYTGPELESLVANRA